MKENLTFLGIETSCDETAASVVREKSNGTGEILSNVVSSQINEHKEFGGVVPEIAARAHVEKIEFKFPNEKNPHIEHNRILQNFTNFLLDEEELYVPGDQGLNCVELINAMILSGFEKNEITLPINEKKYEYKLNKIIMST